MKKIEGNYLLAFLDFFVEVEVFFSLDFPLREVFSTWTSRKTSSFEEVCSSSESDDSASFSSIVFICGTSCEVFGFTSWNFGLFFFDPAGRPRFLAILPVSFFGIFGGGLLSSLWTVEETKTTSLSSLREVPIGDFFDESFGRSNFNDIDLSFLQKNIFFIL